MLTIHDLGLLFLLNAVFASAKSGAVDSRVLQAFSVYTSLIIAVDSDLQGKKREQDKDDFEIKMKIDMVTKMHSLLVRYH